MTLSESAIRSRTPSGSRVESSRSLTSSSRRWLASWWSQLGLLELEAPDVVALTRAWAA